MSCWFVDSTFCVVDGIWITILIRCGSSGCNSSTFTLGKHSTGVWCIYLSIYWFRKQTIRTGHTARIYYTDRSGMDADASSRRTAKRARCFRTELQITITACRDNGGGAPVPEKPLGVHRSHKRTYCVWHIWNVDMHHINTYTHKLTMGIVAVRLALRFDVVLLCTSSMCYGIGVTSHAGAVCIVYAFLCDCATTHRNQNTRCSGFVPQWAWYCHFFRRLRGGVFFKFRTTTRFVRLWGVVL